MADIRIVPAQGAINVTGSADFRGAGGASVLFVTGSGQIGAGTTVPDSEFHVVGSGTRFLTLDRSGVRSYDLGVNSSGTFLVTDNSAAVDRIALSHSGSVGIGTTQPTQLLHLVNSAGPVIRLVRSSNRFDIEADTNSAGIVSRDSATANFSITGFGNVGIGSASPAVPLDVVGTTKISGGDGLYINSSVGDITNLFTSPSVHGFYIDFPSSYYMAIRGTSEFMRIASTGAIKFNTYGSGTNTGTAAYNLSVDSSGNIIETANPSLGGSGTANYVTKWSNSSTLTDSIIYDDGTNIGVGESSPSYKLHVGGTFRASGLGSFGGNVGIGTTNPSQKLQIGASTDTVSYARIVGSTSDFYLGQNSTSAHLGVTNGAKILQTASYPLVIGTTANQEVYLGANNATIMTLVTGNVGIGSSIPEGKLNVVGSADVLIVEGSGSTANTTLMAVDGNNGRLFEVSDDLSDSLFSVNTIAGLPVMEAFADNTVTLGAYNQYDLHITGSSVGIGTSVPEAKLDVRAGSSFIRLGSYDNNYHIKIEGGDQLNFRNGASAATAYIQYAGPGHTLLSRNLFVEANSSGGVTGAVRVTADGNVGIGTTSPGAKLDVSGSIYVRSGNELRLYNPAGNDWGVLNFTATNDLNLNSTVTVKNSGGVNSFYPNTTEVTDLGRSSFQFRDGYLSRNLTVGGDLTVTGIITAKEFHTTFVSASIIYQSGSTQFGNSSDDTHVFTGNIGIGTTNPGYKLDVIGDARISSNLSINGYSVTDGIIYHASNINVLNKAGNGWLTWATRNTSGAEVVVDLNYLGSVTATSFTGSLLGNVIGNVTGNVTGTAASETLATVTGRGATTAVPITMSYPGTALALSGTGSNISFKDVDNVWTGYVGFDGNTGQLSFPGRNVLITAGYNGTIELSDGASGYNAGKVYVPYGNLIVENGNIGIGITSPGYKLQVAGDARIDNTLYINNSNGTAIVNAYSGGSIGTYLAKASSATANFITTGVSYPRGLGFGAIIGQGNTTDIPVNNSSWNGGYGGLIGFWSDLHYGVEGGTNAVGYNAVIKGTGNSNSYGFFADLSGATDGTRYGIYTKGEQYNYFSGNVGIGSTAPSNKLQVVGGVTATSFTGSLIGDIYTNSIYKQTAGSPILLNAGLNASLGARVYYDLAVYNSIFLTNSSWTSQGYISGDSGILTYGANTGHKFDGKPLTLTNDFAFYVSGSGGGYPTFYADNGSAQIGFGRQVSSTGLSYLGSDATYLFRLWDASFNQGYFNVVRSNGNVGIGVTTPGYKLHVDGTGYFTGALTANSNFTVNGRYFINGSTTFGYKIAYNGLTLGNGTVVSDSNAADGNAIYMASANGSTMFYGPYTSISNGEYVASFRMKVSDNSSTSTLGQIDVIGTNTLGSTMVITPSMFETSDRYQYIDIPFTANGSNANVEFRGVSFNAGITNTYLDHIIIRPLSKNYIQLQPENKNYDIFYHNVGIPRFRIKPDGNVGIGTSAPASRLHTYASNDRAAIRIQNTAASKVWEITPAVPGVANSGISIHNITDNAVYLHIKDDGNVGIGNTNPSTRLHVSSSATPPLTLETGLGNNGIIMLTSPTTYSWLVGAQYNVGNTFEITPSTAAGGGTFSTPSFVINSGGNVGIGATSPSHKLEVRGDVRLRVDATGLGPSIILNNGTEVAGNYSQIAFGGTQYATTYLKGAIAYVTRTETNGRGDFYFLQETTNNGNNAGLGNAVMVVTNLGNVGIGTTSPGSPLDIQSSANVLITATSTDAGAKIKLADPDSDVFIQNQSKLLSLGFSSTQNGQILHVSSSGNVGIGTASPANTLDLGSGTAGRALTWGNSNSIFSSYSAGSLVLSSNFYGSTTTDTYLTYITATFGAAGIRVGATDGTSNSGLIRFFVDAAAAKTAGAAFTPSERMRINGSGQVFINSTSMDGKFGINTDTSTAYNPNAYNGTNANIRLTNGSAGVGRYTGIAFGGGGSTEAFIGSVQNVNELAEIVFQTYNGSAYGERMRMNSSGNVGIGTNDPAQLLQVQNSVDNAERGIRILNSHANTSADASLRIDGYAGSYIDFYRNQSFRWRFNRIAFSDDLKITADTGAGGAGDVMYFDYDTGNVGIGSTAPEGKLNVVGGADVLIVEGSGSTANTTIMAVDGNNGRLFEVSDDLSDSLFSVNTIAGLPVMEAFADNTVVLGAYNQCDLVVTGSKVGIGTCSVRDYSKFEVRLGQSESAKFGSWEVYTYGVNNAWIGENVYFDGTDFRHRAAGYANLLYSDAAGGFQIRMTPSTGAAGAVLSSAKTFVILPNGNVGINQTAPSYKLDVSGTIRATGDVIAYSDARVKENVVTLENSLEKVQNLRGVSYNKIGEPEKKIGVIAQEVLEVIPEVVSQDSEGTYSVAYGNITAVLIEAIKEQQKQIDELKEEIRKLKN